jgi:hypothetical protein
MVNVCTRLNQQFQCLGITLIRRMKQWSPALRINAIEVGVRMDCFSQVIKVTSLCSPDQ